jgi:hypothetical protein
MVSRDTIIEMERVERDVWIDMYASIAPQARERLGVEQRPLDDGVLLVCRAIDHMQFNRISNFGVAATARGEVLDAAIAAYDAAGVTNWIVHVAPGADELARLCDARGLVAHPRTWMRFIRVPRRAEAAASLTIREIAASEAGPFAETATASFGLPPFATPLLSGIVGRPRWRCFMAFDAATPVATGAVFIDGTSAWLGVGGTLSSHRGRGAQSAILAARINAAIDAGCTLITTETGIPHPGEAGPSYKNIQRAGFTIAYERPNLRRA